MDSAVLVFTMIVSIGTGLAAGLFPARHFARGELTEGLKEGSRSTTAGHGQQAIASQPD